MRKTRPRSAETRPLECASATYLVSMDLRRCELCRRRAKLLYHKSSRTPVLRIKSVHASRPAGRNQQEFPQPARRRLRRPQEHQASEWSQPHHHSEGLAPRPASALMWLHWFVQVQSTPLMVAWCRVQRVRSRSRRSKAAPPCNLYVRQPLHVARCVCLPGMRASRPFLALLGCNRPPTPRKSVATSHPSDWNRRARVLRSGHLSGCRCCVLPASGSACTHQTARKGRHRL